MVKVKFIDCQGSVRIIEASVGDTIMQAAVFNSVPGVDAECGGACSCATCHIYVDSAWLEQVGDPGVIEVEMLEIAEGVKDNSRLGCQIVLTEDLDGVTVTTPESQV